MAPSFLKDFRRRSKASFKNEKSTTSGKENSSASNGTYSSVNSTTNTALTTDTNSSTGTVARAGINGSTRSSSTLNSVYGGNTPPALTSSSSASNLQNMGNVPPSGPPTRPTVLTSSTNRYSVSGMSGLGSPAQKSLQSPYAPRVLNILDGSIVYQKILLVTGVIADPATQKMDGTLTLSRSDDAFPATQWPVSDSHWKSIAYLLPGPNRLRFDFMSPKLANSNSPNPIHSTHITIHYVPPLSAPPLQLVILLGSDSPGTFDAVPARIEREGNDINTAVKKYRIAAYLWQAYTAEQMSRNKLGRRTFRFEEEWMTGTSNYRDINNATMRSEAKVHVIRVAKTVAELRDIEIAQQNPNATRSNDLHLIATEAVRDHFRLQPGQKCYVAAMYLDSHWDKQANLITGHAALGGSGNDIALAIFGSQALQSYPSCIEEVVPAFSDCTPTDTSFVANDCNESGSSWEAANIGIGAHLHEVGHVFGCPHQESGVMLRDYVRLNRSFTTREPYSTRTKEKGGVVISMKDECTWHRTDCLRFKSHPCFQMPGDVQRSSDDSVHVWPVDNGSVIITAASGVSFLEIRIDGDELCHYWMEYGDGNGSGPTLAHVALTEQELRSRLPEDKKEAKLSLSIKSHGGGSCEVADFGVLISKASKLKLTNGDMAFRGSKLGLSRMEGSTPDEVVFSSVIQQTKLMTHVRIYHGLALDGIEFYYEDATSQLFGKKGGQAGGSVFNLDIRRGEYINGFYVRAGAWVDGIAIITSTGRKSQIYGNPTGGSGHTIMPPRGYHIAGITGSCADWVDGFGILLTR